jgi:hypothetical protein
MTRPIPKSLFRADFRPLWRSSRRFIAAGMRLTGTGSGKGFHVAGGRACHKGSTCPHCGKRLTLLWDLGLRDPLIPDYVRKGFAPAKRLPLYICWQCVAASYRVASDERMTCFDFDSHTDPLRQGETPFRDSPDELPRRKIDFERIPSTVDALLSLENAVGLDALDLPARKAIDKYYRKRVKSNWDLPFSQFGGQPIIYQPHRNVVCPNPKCPASRLQHPYGELEMPYLMKEMALIHFDHEPELAKHCFQLLYHVCGICFGIRVEYRCD